MRRSILVVAPYIPLPATFGGALRIYNLVKILAADHDVSVLAPGSEDDLKYVIELGEICNVTLVPAATTTRQPAGRAKRMLQVRSLATGVSWLETAASNSRMQSSLDRVLATRHIDLVQYEFPESAIHNVPPRFPTVFDAHNVEHDLLSRVASTSQSSGKQVFNMLEARKVKWLERRIWDRATTCIATSERDADLMRSLTSTPVDVVPNGVDLEYFSAQPPDHAAPARVVFTGAMRHQPNADGAEWYARRVHPLVLESLAGSTFGIIGADPPPAVTALASAAIQVTGKVDDVRPYLAQATVVAVPLWSGGGTRLKILEAFASGRPVVSTSIGAEGLNVRHGEHLMIADTAHDFSRAITRIGGDPDLARRLATAGRTLVEQQYGWHAIAQQLAEAHDRAIRLHRS